MVDSDDYGGMVTAHLKFHTKEMLITNINAPNSPSAAFYQDATRWVLKKPHYPHLIGGDFNTVLRNGEDRSTQVPSSSQEPQGHITLLEQFTLRANLIDH